MKSFFALKGGQDKKASEQESSHFGKQERSQSSSLAQVYHPDKQTHVTIVSRGDPSTNYDVTLSDPIDAEAGLNIPLCLNL